MKTIQMVTAPSKKQSRTLNTKGVVVNRNDVANEKRANDQVERSNLDNPIKVRSYNKPIKLFGVDYNVIDNVYGLKTIEEIKSFLPAMNDDEYQKLKADIKLNGIYDPILYFTTEDGDKIIFDGHTRLRIAIDLELEKTEIPNKEIVDEFESIDEIKLKMLEHQKQRRNMTPVERLIIASSLKSTIEKLAKINLSKGGKKMDVQKIDTNEEIGKNAGVSRATVIRFNRVLENGSEEIKKDMLSGEITIGSAVKLVDKLRHCANTEKNQVKSNEVSDIDGFSKTESSDKLIKSDEKPFISDQQNIKRTKTSNVNQPIKDCGKAVVNNQPNDVKTDISEDDQPIISIEKAVVNNQPSILNEGLPDEIVKKIFEDKLSEYFKNKRVRGFIIVDDVVHKITSSDDINNVGVKIYEIEREKK